MSEFTEPVLSTEPEEWVTTSRSRGYFGVASPPVLHRPGCRFVKRTDPENVFPEFGGEKVSADWVYTKGTGFDRACKVCCSDLAPLF